MEEFKVRVPPLRIPPYEPNSPIPRLSLTVQEYKVRVPVLRIPPTPNSALFPLTEEEFRVRVPLLTIPPPEKDPAPPVIVRFVSVAVTLRSTVRVVPACAASRVGVGNVLVGIPVRVRSLSSSYVPEQVPVTIS
jgi:hypothetical protein